MFIPVGHDVDGLRRWPIVTFAIMAICAVVFAAAPPRPGGDPELVSERFEAAAGYWFEHPELRVHPLLRRWIEHAIDAEEPEVQAELRAHLEANDAATPLQDVRQAKLDELTGAWLAALRDGPAGRQGLIPSEVVPSRYLTHLFVHGDVLHLAFNMLFLYLSAPLIEDVWGRPAFALFYLLAGVGSAWIFVQQYPDLALPLIGASGAVAGVLGAMLVRHPQTRIRILWLWGFVVRRFTVPAWVVLPIWGAGELGWAWVMDAVAPGTGGGGVAHWVHVDGFLIGAAVAGAVRVLGLERVLASEAGTGADHAVLRRVERALAHDRRDEAWRLLAAHVVRTPADHDAALVYWDLAKMLGRAREAAPVLLRVIRAELLAHDEESARAHWRDLHAAVADLVAEPELAARLACAFGDAGHGPEAAELVRTALARVDVATPAAALVELARAARFADAPVAAEAVARALAHPGVSPAVRRELAGEAAGLGAAPPPFVGRTASLADDTAARRG
ncbi:MAG: rhomboid family intramembrane serine protease [Deltaproteobacteria bacterium]|nr:rhomboid family intramembrane serine protease [Deltaproteobacteria bacterium]